METWFEDHCVPVVQAKAFTVVPDLMFESSEPNSSENSSDTENLIK
jgi:hypothetical protein